LRTAAFAPVSVRALRSARPRLCPRRLGTCQEAEAGCCCNLPRATALPPSGFQGLPAGQSTATAVAAKAMTNRVRAAFDAGASTSRGFWHVAEAKPLDQSHSQRSAPPPAVNQRRRRNRGQTSEPQCQTMRWGMATNKPRCNARGAGLILPCCRHPVASARAVVGSDGGRSKRRRRVGDAGRVIPQANCVRTKGTRLGRRCLKMDDRKGSGYGWLRANNGRRSTSGYGQR